MEGLKVKSVESGKYGDNVGILAGDIIVKYGDRKVPNTWTLESTQKYLMELGYETVNLELLRKGEKVLIEVIPKMKLSLELEVFSKKPTFEATSLITISKVTDAPAISVLAYLLSVVTLIATIILISMERDEVLQIVWGLSGAVSFLMLSAIGMLLHYIKGIFINTYREQD
ncbi:PDZ domain-containing protein [Psychrosphaera sp.]|nr:PDZ domain-containing protein [Psychrosphaera sp.]